MSFLVDEESGSHPPYVIDRYGTVWHIVHDGGMATRAHYGGIKSIGINTLDQESGPLLPFDPHVYLFSISRCACGIGHVGAYFRGGRHRADVCGWGEAALTCQVCHDPLCSHTCEAQETRMAAE